MYRWDNSVLKYKDTNFEYWFCRKFGDFGFDELYLFLNKNGKQVKGKIITPSIDKYQIEIEDVKGEEYNKIINDCKSKLEKANVDDTGVWSNIVGTAEQIVEQDNNSHFYGTADFNNDGISVNYEKYIWLTSTQRMSDHLEYSIDNNKNYLENMIDDFDLYNSKMFWVDKDDKNENVICIVSKEDDNILLINGYKIIGENCEKVFSVYKVGIKEYKTLENNNLNANYFGNC